MYTIMSLGQVYLSMAISFSTHIYIINTQMYVCHTYVHQASFCSCYSHFIPPLCLWSLLSLWLYHVPSLHSISLCDYTLTVPWCTCHLSFTLSLSPFSSPLSFIFHFMQSIMYYLCYPHYHCNQSCSTCLQNITHRGINVHTCLSLFVFFISHCWYHLTCRHHSPNWHTECNCHRMCVHITSLCFLMWLHIQNCELISTFQCQQLLCKSIVIPTVMLDSAAPTGMPDGAAYMKVHSRGYTSDIYLLFLSSDIYLQILYTILLQIRHENYNLA